MINYVSTLCSYDIACSIFVAQQSKIFDAPVLEEIIVSNGEGIHRCLFSLADIAELNKETTSVLVQWSSKGILFVEQLAYCQYRARYAASI